jgi:hypothetical protein
MIIDCSSCKMRDLACGDCVVSFILDAPTAELERPQIAALEVLATKGLVPPLRFTS